MLIRSAAEFGGANFGKADLPGQTCADALGLAQQGRKWFGRAADEESKMPMIDADGCLLNVSVEGRDGGPTLMLSNSLGCTLQMWEPQMKALTQLFRVIRYDRRGHGKSGVPPGPYSMERFGRDVLAILDDLNIDKVHWCGL